MLIIWIVYCAQAVLSSVRGREAGTGFLYFPLRISNKTRWVVALTQHKTTQHRLDEGQETDVTCHRYTGNTVYQKGLKIKNSSIPVNSKPAGPQPVAYLYPLTPAKVKRELFIERSHPDSKNCFG